MTRAVVAILILAAAVNISAGVVILRDPVRARDFRTVRTWSGQWLIDAENIYEPNNSRVDYPPHAIVLFSPLSLVPASVAVTLWIALNIALAIAAPWLVARLVSPRATAVDLTILTLLFLCWSGTKVFTQFTLVSVVAGSAALLLADRRPHWSAFCLAIAAMKPQIAVPFVLWFLFTRRWLTLIESCLIAIAALLLFCIRVHAVPTAVAVRYAEILKALYTGPYQMVGASNLHPLVASIAPDSADVVAASIALVVLAAISLVGFAARTARKPVMYASLAMGAVWSLLSFYHLTYGFVLLLPTSALLWLDDDRATGPLRRVTFWVLQVLLIVDIPGVWRRVERLLPPNPIGDVLPHFDRMLFVVLMVVLFVISSRGLTTKSAAEPVS